jgi:hypothetical protein
MTAIREQIIVADKAIVDSIDFIKTVKRSMMSYEELKNFASTQVPIGAVVGRLPKAEQYHRSGRRREIIGQIESSLVVDVFVYFQNTTIDTMDTEVSEKANIMFEALFADPGRGGLCLETTVDIKPDYAFWDPFVAFTVKVSHLYIHTTGGI